MIDGGAHGCENQDYLGRGGLSLVGSIPAVPPVLLSV